MKFKIEIKTSKLPILYRHRVVSLFKEALQISDPTYKNLIYKDSSPKSFTFNLSLPKGFELKKEEVKIDDFFNSDNFKELKEIEVFYLPENSFFNLWVSSSDYRFLISLYNGLQKLKIFDFSSDTTMLVNGEKIRWDIKRIFPIKDRTINARRVILKTCSPILLEKKVNGKKIPITFKESEEFEDVLNNIMDSILKTLRGYGLKERIHFKKLAMQTQKIKHTLREFREKAKIPYMTLTVNKGIFKLEGNPDDLNYLLKIGIGNKRGQGFGMVEVVG